MNRISKTRNLSANQTIQFFNSTQMLKTKINEKLNLEDLENIYNYFYEDNFHNILIKNKFSFLNFIESKIQEVIRYNFDDSYLNSSFFRRTINKYKKELENKYINDYSLLNEEYTKNINLLKDSEREYIHNYLQHCINSNEIAYHPCSQNKKGKFILVSEKSNKFKLISKEIKYVLCLDCKQCYKGTCFYNIK